MASRIVTARSPGGRLLTIELTEGAVPTAERAEDIARHEGRDGYIVVSSGIPGGETVPAKRAPDDLLSVSILLRPSLPPARVMMLPAIGALALCRAVRHHTALLPSIRWVGEVYAGKERIAEATTRGALRPGGTGFTYVIVTLSLRITKDFTGRLTEVIKSVFSPRRESVPERISETVINEFFAIYEAMTTTDSTAFLDEYRDLSLLRGKRIRVLRGGKPRRATVLGIDDNAGLVVALRRGGSMVLHSASELYDPKKKRKH
ncbi:MAG: hypothetical protein IJF73_04015 [Clostridia bacterium]|nr:hypothetical protein [Clostridia bacterium]